VGHETDYTLIDFVSDLRAPTPSAAAEIALKSNMEIISELENYKSILNIKISNKLSISKNKLEELSLNRLLLKKKNSVKEKFYLLDNINLKINMLINDKINRDRNYIETLLIKLYNNNPIEILKKGYSITKNETNNVIFSTESVNEKQIIKTILLDGEIISKVIKVSGDIDE
jgi:exodeoxyribonuclease VII large subunit